MAGEINVRLGKAEGYDGQAETAMKKADDHRLAAALRLADARTLADDHRIGWKRWVDKNIDRSYRDVKRLVAIGSAEDPVLALESARKHGRDAKARSRDRDGGVIGDRAPAHPEGQQTASEDESAQFAPQIDASVVIASTVTVAGVITLADRLSPGDVQALVSHLIRNRLSSDEQRKLAKGLNAMLAQEKETDHPGTPAIQPRRKLMAEENNVAELTNVKARHTCITKGFEDIYKIEEEIAELNREAPQ